jgi:hypothetical protein
VIPPIRRKAQRNHRNSEGSTEERRRNSTEVGPLRRTISSSPCSPRDSGRPFYPGGATARSPRPFPPSPLPVLPRPAPLTPPASANRERTYADPPRPGSLRSGRAIRTHRHSSPPLPDAPTSRPTSHSCRRPRPPFHHREDVPNEGWAAGGRSERSGRVQRIGEEGRHDHSRIQRRRAMAPGRSSATFGKGFSVS